MGRDQSDWVSPDLWEKHKDKFEPCDLVEFRRDGKLFQHWGLYLGDSLVVHVSSYDLWHPFASFGGRFSSISQAAGDASLVSHVPVFVEAPMESTEAENNAARPVDSVCCEDVVVMASPLELGYGLEERAKWFIKVEHILRIAGQDQFRVNNVAQRICKRVMRTPREIFKLVNRMRDKEVYYSLTTFNCEHFVTSLKYKDDSTEEPDVIVMIPSGTSSQVRRAVGSAALAAVVGVVGFAFASWLTAKPSQPGSSGKPSVPVAKTKQAERC